MSKNFSRDSLENRLINLVNNAVKTTKQQRTKQLTYKGYLNLPVLAADPAVTGTNEYGLYFNSSTNKVRKSFNGSAWTDTTI